MHLDAFWDHERSTVSANLSTIKKGLRLNSLLGIAHQYEPLGPYPEGDIMGYGIAIQMLMASLEKGKKGRTYCQFETIRHLRTGYGNAYRASARAVSEAASFNTKGKPTYFTTCPTQSYWFSCFVRGCKKRMGSDAAPDLAISVEVFRELMNEIQNEAMDSTGVRLLHLLCFGAYCTICFTASLRGNEGFLLDLRGLMSHIQKGKDDPVQPHVVAPLLGRFKGETGERYHMLALPNVTKTGIEIRKWLEAVVVARESEGRSHGPAFCDAMGLPVESGVYEATFHEMLIRIQIRLPDLIAPEINVREEYGISRSFRRGSDTHAKNQGVSGLDIDVMNRWRTIESAKGRRPRMNMRDHYSEVRQMLTSLLRYPTAL